MGAWFHVILEASCDLPDEKYKECKKQGGAYCVVKCEHQFGASDAYLPDFVRLDLPTVLEVSKRQAEKDGPDALHDVPVYKTHE